MDRTLYLQCLTGISGDMLLAALADLGADFKPLQKLLNRSGLPVKLRVSRERKLGLLGTKAGVEFDESQPLRGIEDIRQLVEKLEVSPTVKDKTLQAFKRLSEVEAEVHGISVQDVHFHELGALDTIVDVVGSFWALEELKVKEIFCSSLPWFEGHVQSMHGKIPLPAPATVRLLQGKPVYNTDFIQEIITPTGALLLDQIVDSFISGPTGYLEHSAMGWGSIDLGEVPNALRIFLSSAPSLSTERVWILESNIDHLTGEELGNLFDVLFSCGALDVLFLPGVMKKNRPGGMLQVICTAQNLTSVQNTFFENSLTLGIRRYETERLVLPRYPGTRSTSWGDIETKEIQMGPETFSKPEFESLRKLAQKTGRSLVQLRYLLGDKDNKGQEEK